MPTIAIDLDNLKTEIETLLGDAIGTYTFSEGQTIPAIRIEDGNDPYPQEPQVEGLEVVIRPGNTIGFTPLLGGDRRFDVTAEIVLKQWDVLLSVRDALEVLMVGLEGVEEIGAIVPRSILLDSLESCTLTIGDGFYTLGRS